MEIRRTISVSELINLLLSLEQSAEVSVCGNDNFYITQDSSGTMVNIDAESQDTLDQLALEGEI